jgi:hypothetical protein
VDAQITRDEASDRIGANYRRMIDAYTGAD